MYLNGNNICDIDILNKVDFKKLKVLYLNNNLIADIKVLERTNFNELNELNLKCNNIKDKDDSPVINFLRNTIKNFSL